MALRKRIKRALPWWLGGGERCAGCEHAHAVNIRCVNCDRGFCPFCVTIESGEAFCDQCLPPGGGP